jgi:hypothetical protein
VAAEISADGAVAAGRSAAGADVILLLAEGVPFGVERGGPGRVAVFVTGGDPAPASDRLSEVDRAAVAAMAGELFGGLVGAPDTLPDDAERADRPG